MRVILKFFIFGILMTIISGCSGKSLPIVEQEELDKYEKSYIAEYQTTKLQNANYQPSFKWVQPKNKKEECKVYVGINPNDDRTIKSDYSLYWDGECRNGYAFNLGREIENTMLSNIQQIGYYDNGEVTDYCVQFDPINNFEFSGECSSNFNKPNHYVKKIITEKNGDLNIVFELGIMSSPNNPSMFMKTWVFFDAIEYYKVYPNYAYIISDITKSEFDVRNYEFYIKDLKTDKFNGFSFATLKDGSVKAFETIDGNFVRNVELPQSYFNKANSILTEIRNEVNIALEAQRRALIIKEKYINKICKDTVKVDFMDNNEYKAICKEDEKNAQLKIKIDAKLAQIAQQKQAKRQQRNEERLIQAREAEAMAAKRQASAAQASAEAQQYANTNQMMQNNLNNLNNVNNNLQMQNLNNNLNNINNTLNNSNSGSYNNGGGYYNERSLLQK